MIRYIRADLRRCLRKKGFYGMILFLMLITSVGGLEENAVDQIEKMKGVDTRLVASGREYEFDVMTKRKNIEYIKSLTNVKIGCGDNDLHALSDSLNCCGIDTMPKAFSNWMKYNSMYIKMTGDRSQWSPQSNCNECLNGDCMIKGFTKMSQYVDKSYMAQYGNPNQGVLDLWT